MPDIQTSILAILTVVVGLCVGSFLNVIILRLPPRIKYGWRRECAQLLKVALPEEKPPPGLLWPSSRCPTCHTSLKAWHLIPLVSYLLLKTRCAYCKEHISIRYPLIEILTSLLTLFTILHFDVTAQGLLALPLVWGLIVLSITDLDEQLLPDLITIPLLWLGLIINTQAVFVPPTDAILGAVAGYGVLWLIVQFFRGFTNKQGMGHGDFKLLALLGAWLGWQALAQIIVVASVSGALVGLTLIFFRRAVFGHALAFGPYLASAGLITLYWGKEINAWYLNLAEVTYLSAC